MSRQTGGRLPSPSLLSGTLPPRQPSSRSTRPRSAVSTVRVSSPRTSTRIASSPKSCLKRSVSLKLWSPVDERLRGRARLEPQRERGAAQRQQGGEPKHQQRPPRHGAHEASEHALDHAVSLGEALRRATAAAAGAGTARLARRGGRAAPARRTAAPCRVLGRRRRRTGRSGPRLRTGTRSPGGGGRPCRAEVAAEHLEVALGPSLSYPPGSVYGFERFVSSRNGQPVIISGFAGFAVRR